jgi:transcriptional regulator with XRE-family HTH domain
MPTDKNGDTTWVIRNPGDLGRAISGARRERGISQESLAEELGIDRSYLSKMERDSSSLAMERGLRALRRLGATITVTLTHDDGR